jgi:hypothetical protein
VYLQHDLTETAHWVEQNKLGEQVKGYCLLLPCRFLLGVIGFQWIISSKVWFCNGAPIFHNTFE